MRLLRDVRFWSALAMGGLVAALLVHVSNLATARRMATAAEAHLLRLGGHDVAGLDRGGVAVSTQGAGCVVVRYSSGACRFCREDLASFSRLHEQLVRQECRSFVISPTSEDRSPEEASGHFDGAILPYVSPSFAVEADFSRTPTTVILIGDRAWSKIGALSERDMDAALAFVRGAEADSAGHRSSRPLS